MNPTEPRFTYLCCACEIDDDVPTFIGAPFSVQQVQHVFNMHDEASPGCLGDMTIMAHYVRRPSGAPKES